MASRRLKAVVGGTLALAGAVATYWRWRANGVPYREPETLIVAPPDEDWRARFLPIESSLNFRDLGGYRTEDGRVVRRGQVFRAGSLSDLTEADQQALVDLGIRQVIDLRTPKEIERKPDRLPPALAESWVHLPAYVENNSSEFLKRLVRYRGRLDQALADGYLELIDRRAPQFGLMLKRIAAGEGTPVVVHCTAGKDRTGLISALILSAVGVPDAIVIADYSLTNHHSDRIRIVSEPDMRRIRRLGLSMAATQPLLVADPDNMRAVMAHLRERYGSTEAYLLNQAGLSPDDLARLRVKLLTEAS
jgi:protein-tyrosine phosphatase